jgi:hypothetical protein
VGHWPWWTLGGAFWVGWQERDELLMVSPWTATSSFRVDRDCDDLRRRSAPTRS